MTEPTKRPAHRPVGSGKDPADVKVAMPLRLILRRKTKLRALLKADPGWLDRRIDAAIIP
jgi:hypothetical protein